MKKNIIAILRVIHYIHGGVCVCVLHTYIGTFFKVEVSDFIIRNMISIKEILYYKTLLIKQEILLAWLTNTIKYTHGFDPYFILTVPTENSALDRLA